DLSVELVLFVHIFFFSRSVPHRDLHSFPTRRSSDLQGRRQFLRAAVLAREVAARGGERRLDALLLVGESALAGGSVRDAEEGYRSEEHTSELQSRSDLVCRLLLEKKKKKKKNNRTLN